MVSLICSRSVIEMIQKKTVGTYFAVKLLAIVFYVSSDRSRQGWN